MQPEVSLAGFLDGRLFRPPQTLKICRTEIRSVVSYLTDRRSNHPNVVKPAFVISFVQACDSTLLRSDQTVLLQIVQY